MSYFLKHTAEFNTPVTEQVKIELYKKSDVSFTVEPLRLTFTKKQALSGDGNGADTIISNELTFGIWLTEANTAKWGDFIVSFHDEWKVILYLDNQIEFIGFLTPNEGSASLIGIRREISLSASDNLGLLKKAPFKRWDGVDWRQGGDKHRFIDYICGALAQTGLQLNVKVYANLYEGATPDRNTNPDSETFNQYWLDYRMFMTDPLNWKDCNTSLLAILSEGYMLEQWNGKWVITRLGEMQGSAGPKIWSTEYAYDATLIHSEQYLNDPAIVDKQQTLHPIGGELNASCSYSVKRARHTYNYNPWQELPKNNTFERGTFIPGIGVNDPINHTTQRAYTIDDWTYYRVVPGNAPVSTTDLAYRLSTYNIYGVEIARVVVLESHFNDPGAGHRFLRSSAFPIKAGDKLDIDFDFRREPGGTGTMDYIMVSIQGPSGTYRLNNNNPPDGGGPFFWSSGNALKFPSKFYQGENWQDWSTISMEIPAAPIDGDLIIDFLNYDSSHTKAFYRNFSLTYHPFVAGGYVEAKGDYWNTEQNAAYLDEIDEEVLISDSEIKVLQGAILRASGDLTTRAWHRFGVNENRGYKELINLARYNMAYRRFWEITGSFGGLGYYPANNQAIRLPLGFHKHFIFPGVQEVASSYFQLVPPLTIDYTAGSITAKFRESYAPGLNDGNQEGNLHEFKYKF